MYKENFVTLNAPEKFRDFRETGPVASQDRPCWSWHQQLPVILEIIFFALDH